MKPGIFALALAYVLSQFYRAFLAVLAPVMSSELGVDAESLAQASGWWFLAFAVMQLPVGSALDRIGPRLTASVLLAVAAAGAAVFAMAQGPGAINLAMVLIGAGCSSVLMSSYFIFARSFSPAVFGTLAGVLIGFGSLGNLGASLPLSWAIDAMGWRGAIWALSVGTLLIAIAVALLVRDPEKLGAGPRGSLFDLLRMPALWPILIMMAACYAPAAGLRGLWAGPWRADVFGEGAPEIGTLTLIMGLAMVAGNFAYGPLDRVLGTRKWLVFGGNAMVVACLLALSQQSDQPGYLPMLLFAGVGFFGASFPMVMAHGRAFLPPALMGRGVTLMNLFGIGATGLMQMLTGQLHAAVAPLPPAAPYTALFLFYAALTVAGLGVYVWSSDRTD